MENAGHPPRRKSPRGRGHGGKFAQRKEEKDEGRDLLSSFFTWISQSQRAGPSRFCTSATNNGVRPLSF